MVLGMGGGMIWVIIKYSADENITQNSPLCNNTERSQVEKRQGRDRPSAEGTCVVSNIDYCLEDLNKSVGIDPRSAGGCWKSKIVLLYEFVCHIVVEIVR